MASSLPSEARGFKWHRQGDLETTLDMRFAKALTPRIFAVFHTPSTVASFQISTFTNFKQTLRGHCVPQPHISASVL